ncbi:hypothetical protein GC163_13390 [bacterium]|nr:hypothetical protein [bacterium]
MPTRLFRCGGVVTLLAISLSLLSAANQGPIRQLTLDPDAAMVPLFDGMESGQFEVRMSAINAYQSNVVIANTGTEAVTVAVPKAAVGVHILPQFGFGNGPGQNQGQGFFSGNNNGQNGQAGQAQGVGGTMQGNSPFGQSNGNNNFFGNGFPSVPAEMVTPDLQQYGGLATIPAGKSILLKMKTVCLSYGRPDPMSKMTYRLVPVEEYSSDPVLAELLESYTERVDRDTMQAATWHVANGLSWDQIRQLPDRRVPGVSATIFTPRDVQSAEQFVTAVTEAAKDRPASKTPPVTTANRN